MATSFRLARLNHSQRMTVGIADDESARETDRRVLKCGVSGRNKTCSGRAKRHNGRVSVANLDFGLPMGEVVGMLVCGNRASISRAQILEQLDSGAQRRM